MDRNTKAKLVAGAVGALVLAVAVGAAGAASGVLSANEPSQAVIDDAAEQLGIEPTKLSDALAQALKNRVDEAVDEGRLTEKQGTRLKERIDSEDTPLLFGGLGHHGGFGHRGHLGRPGHHLAGLEPAATYLDLTRAELRARLRDGKTLAEVAQDEGKPVAGLVDALVNAAEAKIDKAVENGRLGQERATQLKDGLEERITDLVEGELPARPFGRRFGGPGGLHHGPGHFRGPRA